MPIIEACFSSAALSNPTIKPSAQEVLKDISKAYAIRDFELVESIFAKNISVRQNPEILEFRALSDKASKSATKVNFLRKANLAEPRNPHFKASLAYALWFADFQQDAQVLIDDALKIDRNDPRSIAINALILVPVSENQSDAQAKKAFAAGAKQLDTVEILSEWSLHRQNREAEMMVLDDYLKVSPNDVGCLYLKACAFKRRKKFDDCLNILDKTLRISPKHRSALSLKMLLLKQMKRNSEAIAIAQKRLTIASSRIEIVDTNRFLAKCFEDANDFQHALEARQRLLTLVRADVGINSLGYARDVEGIVRDYLKLQKYKEALAEIDPICRTFPRLTEAFEMRAEALTGLGRNKEALLAWNNLIAANNEIEAFYIGRAKLFAKLGDRKSEEKDLKRAAQLKLENAP